MDIKTLTEGLKQQLNQLHEDSQYSYKMMEYWGYLKDELDTLKAAADKVLKRFVYRTQENVSYTPEEAKEIAMKCQDKLIECRKEIEELYNLIG